MSFFIDENLTEIEPEESLEKSVVNETGFLDNSEGELQDSVTITSSEIGKVAAPPRQEATSKEFFFWAKRNQTLESGQLVYNNTNYGNQPFTTYGIVSEVYRQSRKRDMSEEYDQYDGDINYSPPFNPEGVTFASVTTLRTIPSVQAPPIEGSSVYLGGEVEFYKAYNLDETPIERRLNLGLIKNGGDASAGKGFIDLNYLLGTEAGHLNVNGMAGQGTKSSFLLHTIFMLLHHVRHLPPSAPDKPLIVPIIFNVKGYDLLFIDYPNRHFKPTHLKVWNELGITQPDAFYNAVFYAPQEPGSLNPVQTGRTGSVTAYSWGLADVIEQGLLQFLFAEQDRENPNFTTLILELEEKLTIENVNTGKLELNPKHNITTFDQLLTTVKDAAKRTNLLSETLPSTWQMFSRRLTKLLLESKGVIRRTDSKGCPLNVVRTVTSDPQVIDLFSLSDVPELQRFVVATVFRQLIQARSGSGVVSNLRYLVALDELNRFAPRGASDPITKLINLVASQMRSQGILLLGAQQQASKVSTAVIENAGIKVLGRSGMLELTSDTWRSLSDSAKRKASNLSGKEKLVIQPTFREPLQIEVPYPAWAMRKEDMGIKPTYSQTGNSSASSSNSRSIPNQVLSNNDNDFEP